MAIVSVSGLLMVPVAAENTSAQTAASQASKPSTSAAASLPRLRGTVGPGSTITISRHRMAKGRYRLVVKDESSQHNWHITGPGVDRSTTVEGTGRTVWRVRLRPGTYSIVCDIHSATMSTSLRVTAD